MTDAERTWAQVCEALASDRYEQAFFLLNRAMEHAPAAVQWQLALYAASLHSLYGEAAVNEIQGALEVARSISPVVTAEPLYAALLAEAQARVQGQAGAAPYLEAPTLQSQDPLTLYHAVAALTLAGRAEEAIIVAQAPVTLPPHLQWRWLAWQADAHEALGQVSEAVALYAQAAEGATGFNRAVMRQEQAALLLQQGEFVHAGRVLAEARTEYSGKNTEEALQLATWHYLHAQALLPQGKLEMALTDITEAARLERVHGDPSYGVALVRGQVLAQMGRTSEALEAFQEALSFASAEEKPFVKHELGVALLDLDRPLEAKEHLESALQDAGYPYHPEVLADLAECEYRVGNMPQAQALAEQALGAGATLPASMVLGNVALDYYHLSEALEHFERLIREAPPESRDWVLGHQMAADVLAQQGFQEPAAIYAHAQQALAHLPESDDWYATLQEHLRRAQQKLEQLPPRLLN